MPVGFMSAVDSPSLSSARSGLTNSGTTAPSRRAVSWFCKVLQRPALVLSSNDDVALKEDHDNPHASPHEDPAPRPSSPDVAAEKERLKFGL